MDTGASGRQESSPSYGEKVALEGSAGGDFPYLGIFENAATEFFSASLEHGAGKIVTVDVEAREGLEETAERKKETVEYRKAWRGLGLDEGGTPAVGIDQFDEVALGLRLDTSPKKATGRASSLPADVVEGRSRTLGFEHVGGGEGVGVGDLAIVLFGHLGGGDAKAEEAGIDGSESFLYRGVIQKILVDKGAEFGIRVHQRTTRDGADFVDNGSSAAGFEDGVAD
jgi:hypothetical protein